MSAKFSPITLGCMSLGPQDPKAWNATRYVSDKETGLAAVRRAYELGITHFDTAQGYAQGYSESWLGEALAGIPRDRVTITTKVSRPVNERFPHAFCRENIETVLDQALSRLQTDYLDFFMFHHLKFDSYCDEALDTMERAIVAGKIRAYAACPIFSIRKMKETYPRLHPGHWHTHGGPYWHAPEDPDFGFAASSKEPVVVFAPYLYGLLTGQWGAADLETVKARFTINNWVHPWFEPPSSPHGFYNKPHDPLESLQQFDRVKAVFGLNPNGFRSFLLRYILQIPGVASVCIGFSKPEQIAEAVEASREAPLTMEERTKFYELMRER